MDKVADAVGLSRPALTKPRPIGGYRVRLMRWRWGKWRPVKD